ncbi:hypothetical protein [Actinomadura spongiicola]|uniref:hypothetical protein n=1 Tax=Actinomadura spongiicola TaxID=2303421 RepID=UPI0011C13880|nr:hypothetical protein [Actinomadura spongiicola]
MTLTTPAPAPAPAPVPSSSRARRSCGNACPAVRQHWGTPVAFATLDPAGLLSPSVADIGAEGPPLRTVSPGDVITDLEAATAHFRVSFEHLAATLDPDVAPTIDHIDIDVQIWRHGYALPATGHPADMVAWWVLGAGPAPAHTEAGALTFADPRTGSPLTPLPGRPWGRHLMVRPVPGTHVAVPGWLTSSVVPVAQGQHVVVAFAAARR